MTAKGKGEATLAYCDAEALYFAPGRPAISPRPRFYLIASAALCLAAGEAPSDEAATREGLAAARPVDVESQSANELTCSYPVRADDTAASLQERYGDEARSETLGGAEGSEFPGIALWPDDPARRLEVFLAENARKRVSFVRMGDEAKWQLAGLALGDPPARVREVNGQAFTFWGFSWDYGGYVSDWSGGRLTALPGGCTPSLRFDVPDAADFPLEIVGDVEVSSDDPLVGRVDARLIELGLGFRNG